MGIAKITRNFQVTLPKDVRELKGLKEGDKVIFSIEGERVGVMKLNEDVVKTAAGLWTGMKGTGVEYERKIRSGWVKRFKRETG